MTFAPQTSQSPVEIAGLIEILRREGVKNFLEVGSRYGGSLWRIANALPVGSNIVSVDSGKGMGGRQEGAMASLNECIKLLKKRGYNAQLIVGDSQLPDIVDAVKRAGPFDACFIDADHELRGVTRDWENYGPICRIVAFHDVGFIRPADYSNSKEIGVPILWDQLKQTHRHVEFIDRAYNYGIGVLWRS